MIEEVTIVCVYKSGGGVYDLRYVDNMRNMISRKVTSCYKFVVLSDVAGIPDSILLSRGLEGWWSKLELFDVVGLVLYFDLDTILLKNVDRLVDGIRNLKEGEFRMLLPFNTQNGSRGIWASGIMGWNGDFRFVLDEFRGEEDIIKYRRGGDQEYITKKLQGRTTPIRPINEYSVIYSFKKHCIYRVPEDADIVCFHGSPRIHELSNNKFVRENWG